MQTKLDSEFEAQMSKDAMKMKFLKPFIHALAAAAKKLVEYTTPSNFVAPLAWLC